MKRILTLIVATFMVAFYANAQLVPKYSKQDIENMRNMQKDIMSTGDTIGIYANIDGDWKSMRSIKYKKLKMNTLGTALTAGLAPSKMKAEYAGPTSPYHFKGGKAVFKIYFGQPAPNKLTRWYMFSPSYSLRDFAIGKFQQKRKVRRLATATINVWAGSSMGVETTDDIKMDVQVIEEDAKYLVTITGVPGEYCFLFTPNGVGAYNSVFDFTIEDDEYEKQGRR